MDQVLHPHGARALFLLGHHAQFVGAYFQRVMLAVRLGPQEVEALERHRQALLATLREEAAHVGGLVSLADTLARAHRLEIPPAPRTADAWDAWASAIAAGMRRALDLTQPAASPFVFGWWLGQVRTTLASLITAVELASRGVPLRETLKAGIEDLDRAARRWPAPAALLATTPGGAPVTEAWRPTLAELSRLSRSDIARIDAAGLDALSRACKDLLEALAVVEETAMSSLPADPAW